MKRSAALLLFVVVAIVHADATTPIDELDGSTDEKAALDSADQGKWVRAREQAEKILAANPRSFLGTWVMGLVYHDGEGNHARALYYVRKAHARLHKIAGNEPELADAITWDKKLYKEEADILLEMDHMEEMLTLLDKYDLMYKPRLLGLRVWGEMKLRRFDEARKLGDEMIAADDLNDRLDGYNNLAIIEFEDLRRDAAYKRSLQGMAGTQDRSCILASNAVLAALLTFRFDEAEEYGRKALTAEIKDCPVSAYQRLAPLYLLEGQFQKSISATKSLQQSGIDKRYRPQFAIENREETAGLLYALGKLEDAARIEGDIYDMPGRTGMSSGSLPRAHLTTSAFYWAILDARITEEHERSSVRPFFKDLARRAKIAALEMRRWEVEHAILKLATSEHELIFAMRPYSGVVDPWMIGTFAEALGEGVARKAIAMARALDADSPGAAAYYDAYDGELDWRVGDYASAARLAASALEKLPRLDMLMRWRTMTWYADALRKLGRKSEADDRLREVLESFPTMLRVLGVQLPATVTSDGSAIARAAADRLQGSSRLEKGDLAQITINDRGDSLEICLGDAARQIACTKQKENSHDVTGTISAALDAFQDSGLSPRVEMTQSDISSLDGSPTRIDSDTALKEILNK
jgi:tetratricopeptide (TPR) repeat protein